MKRSNFILLLLGLFTLGAVLTAGEVRATLLTFDTFELGSNSTPIPLDYGGLTWDSGRPDFGGSNLGAWYTWWDPSYATAHSAPSFVFNGFGASDLGFNFPAPVNSVDAWFATAPGSNASATMLQIIGFAGGVPTFFSSLLNLADAPQHLSLTGADISRVVVHNVDPGWFTMDDLQFTNEPQSLPEPSTLLLFGTGLAGVFLLRMRKRV